MKLKPCNSASKAKYLVIDNAIARKEELGKVHTTLRLSIINYTIDTDCT